MPKPNTLYQYPAIPPLDASGCYCLVPLGEAFVRWSLPLLHRMVDTNMSRLEAGELDT